VSLAAAVAAVAVWGESIATRLGLGGAALPWTPECVVGPDDLQIGLTVEEARLATTAVALEHSGAGEPPDVSDLDPEVLQRLAEGPEHAPGPGLACAMGRTGGLDEEQMGATGLTPRAEHLLEGITEHFGEVPVGGFEPGGVDSGHGENSAHYEGRAVDVFYRPVTEENLREGWLLANWLVAHAEEYHVAVIIFDDRIFSTWRSAWGDYDAPQDNEILRHRDHVHVDVQRGD
jgi:hypothetical protein